MAVTALECFAVLLPVAGVIVAYGYAKFLNRQADRDAMRKRIARDDADVWKQTVRAIFDEMHLGPDSVFRGQQRVAQKVIGIIENRHPDYFCAARE